MQPREAMNVELNIEVRSRYHCCRGKAIGNSYSNYMFVALVIQHEGRMRSIILSTVAYRALPYFSTLSNERDYFRGKKVIKYKERVLISSIAFVLKIFRRDCKIVKSYC